MYSRNALACVLSLSLVFCTAQLSAQAHFLRGDANHDKVIDITDPIFTLTFLFLMGGEEPPCMDAADFNDSGDINITDAIASLEWQFQGGAGVEPPAAPWPVFEADPTPDGAEELGCLGPEIELTGNITRDTLLTRDNVYRLVSGVFVLDGVTLTIQEGTTILGDSFTEGLLVVERGGRLVAVGEPTHPVVFTSDQPVGSRSRGDWGGLIILGRGDNNLPTKEGLAEGLENQFWGGGDNVIPTADAGRLSYVRVEFGGTEISRDNEVNAISLFGVGSDTRLDHVQVKYNLDDGFEWFGGNCDLRFGLCVGIGDDSFDYSFGWTGRGQFWVAQQSGDDADRGFEVDNSESEFGARPLTRPVLANVSLIGDPDTNEGTGSTTGITIRRGAGTVLYNAIVTGFKSNGFDVDDGVTTDNNPTNGNFIVDHTIFFNNGASGDVHFASGETGSSEEIPANGFNYTTEEFITMLNENNIFGGDAPIADPYNLASPDFRPQSSATSSPFDPAADIDDDAAEGFFQSAAYYGGVAPNGDDWTQEPWISYQAN